MRRACGAWTLVTMWVASACAGDAPNGARDTGAEGANAGDAAEVDIASAEDDPPVEDRARDASADAQTSAARDAGFDASQATDQDDAPTTTRDAALAREDAAGSLPMREAGADSPKSDAAGNTADGGWDFLNPYATGEQCSELDANGALVEQLVQTAPFSAPQGGMIAAGTYVLIQDKVRVTAAATEADVQTCLEREESYRETLVVTADKMSKSHQLPGSTSRRIYHYTVDGTSIHKKVTCPTGDDEVEGYSVVEDVSGTELWLFPAPWVSQQLPASPAVCEYALRYKLMR